MTGPMMNFPASGGSVQLGNRGGIEQYLPMIMQMLQQQQARRQRQAEVAMGGVAPGAEYGTLSPDMQKSVRRATGRNWSPEEIVAPFQNTEQVLAQGLERVAPRGSLLRTMLEGTAAVRTATGQATPLSSPQSLQQAGESRSRANVALASADENQANLLASAVRKMEQNQELTPAEIAAYHAARGTTPGQVAGQEAAGRTTALTETGAAGAIRGTQEGRELTPQEVVSFRSKFNFVPSEAIAQQMSGSMNQRIMEYGMALLRDPNSSRWGPILAAFGGTDSRGRPLLTMGDLLGAVSTGVSGLIEQGARTRMTQINNAGQARNIILESQLRVAEQIAKDSGGIATPDFIVGVMQGNRDVLRTDRGAFVQNFIQAGFVAALADRAERGDPHARLFTQQLELIKSPQVANNPRLLQQYLNTAREAMINSLTRTQVGFDRPTEAGAEQRAWDAVQEQITRQMGGVTNLRGTSWPIASWFAPQGIQMTPGTGAQAPGGQMTDEQIIQEWLRYNNPMGGRISPTPPAPAGGPAGQQPANQPPAPQGAIPLFPQSVFPQQRGPNP